MSRFVILACLTITMIQHQANDNHLGKQGQQNSQTAQSKTGASTPSQSAANTSDQKPAGDADKKQNQTVNIASVPKIAVKPEKDLQDWTMVACTIILTIVGIVGTCAAIKTLKAINRQAHYMLVHARHFEKLAKAALANSQATTKQADVLATSMRQWVDIENWKAVPWIPEGGTLSLHIQFDVVNPTNLPLTFESVLIQIGEQRNKIDRKNLIPPKGSKPVVTAVTITEEQALKWEDLKELTFMIGGYVQFVDVLEKTQVQPFSGVIACSKKGGVRFIPPFGSGLYITDEEKKSGDPN